MDDYPAATPTDDLKASKYQVAGDHDIDYVLAGVGTSEHGAFAFCSTYHNRLCGRSLMVHPQLETPRLLLIDTFVEDHFVARLQSG